MSTSVNYVIYIFGKWLNLLFNEMNVTTDVYIGWIFIVVLVMKQVVKNILTVPTVHEQNNYYIDNGGN